jgi:hypothetical protein
MSNLHDLKGLQRAREKRKSLEKKTKIFEEEANKEKLSIDKQLLVQILEEENRSHDVAAKELDEKLQEENLMHDDAIKELKEKIADLEKQIKPSSKVESISNETPSEPEQEETEVSQKTPTEVNMDVRSDPFQDVRVLLKESEPTESEVTPEPPKKKKRGFF